MSRVKVRIPELGLNLQDIVFVVHGPRKEKIGELHLSSGSVDWWPRMAKTKITLKWGQFADLMDEHKRRSGRRWTKSTQPKP